MYALYFGTLTSFLVTTGLSMKTASVLSANRFNSTKYDFSEQKLFDYLFIRQRYGSSIRPVINKSHPVQMQLGIAYVQLIELNERQQYLKSNVWIRQTWQNEFLTWNPDDYGGVKKMTVDKSFVWVPDLILHDSVGDTSAGLIDQSSTRIEINADGSHNWFVPMIITSKCNVDITYFPFDMQRCILRFGSWTHDSTLLNLTNNKTSADTDSYLPSSQLELLSIPAKRHVMKYAAGLPPFTDITYELSIRRLPGYYVFNVIIPSVAITGLCLCVFAFPDENSGRMSFIFSCVLSLVFVSLMVSANIPLNSDTTPLISIFMLMSIIQMTLAGVFNVLVICFYRESGKEIPYWIRIVFFYVLAPFSGVFVDTRTYNKNQEERLRVCGIRFVAKKQLNSEVFTYYSQTNATIKEVDYKDILTEFEKFKSRDDAEQELSYIKSFWHCTANVVDRLFFILFIIVWIFSTIMIVKKIPN